MNWKQFYSTTGKARGYGKSAPDRDNGQPSPKDVQPSKDAVHRLNGSGFRILWSLRYSRTAPEGEPVGGSVRSERAHWERPSSCRGDPVNGSQILDGLPLGVIEVNLRKDHCIDQTQTANQRIPAGGPTRAACAPVPDRRPGSRGPVRSGGLGRPLPFTGKGRTRSAKPPIKSTTRNILKILTAALCGRRQPKTTLNNGYLGSRIDEERSEMRYVV